MRWQVERVVWSRDGFTSNGNLSVRVESIDGAIPITAAQNLGTNGLVYSDSAPSTAIYFTNGNRYIIAATQVGLTNAFYVTGTLYLKAVNL